MENPMLTSIDFHNKFALDRSSELNNIFASKILEQDSISLNNGFKQALQPSPLIGLEDSR